MDRTFAGLAFVAITAIAPGCAQMGALAEALEPKPLTTLSPRFDPRQHDRIAVIVVDNTGGQRNGGLQRQVEDEFMRAVIGKGYTLAARSDVSRVMQELRFQASGATAEDIAEVGEMLNVSAILVVSIDDVSTRREATPALIKALDRSLPDQSIFAYATIGGRLISVREAEVLWISSLTDKRLVDNNSGQNDAVPYVSRFVAAALPARI